MEVVTIQSQAYQEIVGKLDAINTRLNAKEKEPKEKLAGQPRANAVAQNLKKNCPALQG